MQCLLPLCRNTCVRLVAIAAAGACLAMGTRANAQNWSGFSYSNPRTGFSYSQQAFYGRGYYSSGFGVSTPRYNVATGSGWGAAPYWGGPGYPVPAVIVVPPLPCPNASMRRSGAR